MLKSAKPDAMDQQGFKCYEMIKSQLGLGKHEDLCIFNKQVHILKLSRDSVGNLMLAYKDVLTNKFIESLISRDQIQFFNKYMIRFKRLSFEPYLTREMWLYDTEGNKRETDSTKMHIEMNWKNGEVKAVMPYPKPWPTATDKNIQDITKLIRLITKDDWAFEAVMNFMAQMAFEKRITKARPTLILLGARATGKNLLVDRIIKQMLPGMWSNLPPDFEKFKGYLTSKLVFLDEAESETTAYQLNSLAKTLSGSSSAPMRKMFRDAHDVPLNTYLVINSNKQPVMISEPPISESLNQWIVLDLKEPLSEKDEYEELVKDHGSDFATWIDQTIGAWMEKVLLPHYEKNLLKRENSGRYGFQIPIKTPLLNLCTLSKSEAETNVLDQLQRAWNWSQEEFMRFAQSKMHDNAPEYLPHWKAYKEKLVISARLREILLPAVKAANFGRILDKVGVRKKKLKSQKIEGRTYTVIELKQREFNEYINPPSEAEIQEGHDLGRFIFNTDGE